MIWPPHATVLEGEVVRMEPLSDDHREGLREAAADPRTFEWINRELPADPEGIDEPRPSFR